MKVRRSYPSEEIPVFQFHIIEMFGMVEGIIVDINHRRLPLPSRGLAVRESSISGRAVDIVHYPVQLRVG